VVRTTDFVIGRGRAACDLPILDNRIARKHAAVIHRNGRYYLKDLGSVDGVHYNDIGMQRQAQALFPVVSRELAVSSQGKRSASATDGAATR